MSIFSSVEGVVTDMKRMPISANDDTGCVMLMTLQGKGGEVTEFYIDLATFFLNCITIQKGDRVVAFYDNTLPVILIYPPRYHAVFVARSLPSERTIKLDYFDSDLTSSDGMLRLNLSPKTKILLPNNQTFLGTPSDRYLAVVYSRSTKSIPAITTPVEIIVLCYQTGYPDFA